MSTAVLPGCGLKAALAEGRFAVTAELGPPRGADPDGVARKAAHLRGWVDAANVTDNQGARVRMSALGAAVLAQQQGLSPIMQLTCRDRNRMALQADLLAAGALGIPHVLLLTGDHPRVGDHPEAKPVFDLDGVQLTWLARTLRDDGVLLSGEKLTVRPQWMVGSVENPRLPPCQRCRTHPPGRGHRTHRARPRRPLALRGPGPRRRQHDHRFLERNPCRTPLPLLALSPPTTSCAFPADSPTSSSTPTSTACR